MCRKVDESINRIVSECPKLAQKEYKRRHDWLGKKIHWEVCKEEGFIVNEKWYEHLPEPDSARNMKFHLRYLYYLDYTK